MRFGSAYYHHPSILRLARDMVRGQWRTKMRPQALIFAGRQLLKGWTVMDRLGEIQVPTLVLAGRDDFLFPPGHQAALAAVIPNVRLQIIERAGHKAHAERPAEVAEASATSAPQRRPSWALPPASSRHCARRPRSKSLAGGARTVLRSSP
jgi:proline iminopeptidase